MIVPFSEDFVFGEKYVALVEGRVREVFLLAIVLDKKSTDEIPQYILQCAGIDEPVRVDFHYHHTIYDGEQLIEFNSILAHSYEDYMTGNFVKYVQLSEFNPFSAQILKTLMPDFSFSEADGCYAYLWHKELLRPVKSIVNWQAFRHDANGFSTDIIENYYYPTEESCRADHFAELELVKF